jgi:S1-C subfamily serine protease
VNGKAAPDTTTTLNMIAEMPPGKSVPVTVMRHNQELRLDVIVGRRKPHPRAEE